MAAPLGGCLMVWAYWLPWGQASFMGFNNPLFTAAELAERDPAWLTVVVAGAITAVVGLGFVALSFRPRRLAQRAAAVVAALFPLMSLAFIGHVFLRLHGEGIRLGWIEGATAKNLELTYRIGLPVELFGAVLALAAFAWLALGRDVP
jgi:hypothetical protein